MMSRVGLSMAKLMKNIIPGGASAVSGEKSPRQVGMNKRSVLYSAALLFSLVIAWVMIGQEAIQGVATSGDVVISTDRGNYVLGEPIIFTGQLQFAENEENVINGVELRHTAGRQALAVSLPVTDTSGLFVPITGELPGSLDVKVTFNNVGEVVGGAAYSGTLGNTLGNTLGSTLGNTLGGTDLETSGTFKGLAPSANIEYVVRWTPPVLLDPQPEFSLITYYPGVGPGGGTSQREVAFTLPQLAAPPVISGVKLDQNTNSQQLWEVPLVGQPDTTALPSSDSGFTIPTVTVSTNKAETDASLPSIDRFAAIPDISAILSGAAAPTGTGEINETATSQQYKFTVKNIPSVSAGTAPNSEPQITASTNLAEQSNLTTVLNGIEPKGITYDGTYFWIIKDSHANCASSPGDSSDDPMGGGGMMMFGPGMGHHGMGGTKAQCDALLQVNATSSSSVLATILLPGSRFEGITYINSALWLVENGFRCEDADSSDDCNTYKSRVYKLPTTSLSDGANVDWFGGSSCSAPCSTDRTTPWPKESWEWESWTESGAITHSGTGSSAKLYVAAKWGGEFVTMDQGTAPQLSAKKWTEGECWSSFDGMAYKGGNLYTIEASDWDMGKKLCVWNASTGKLQDTIDLSLASGDVKYVGGLTFGPSTGTYGDVLYYGAEGKMWNSFAGDTVSTDSPKGVTLFKRGSTGIGAQKDAIFVVVDGTPFDKIMKISWDLSSQATSTMALDTSFDSDGIADAPSGNIEGLVGVTDADGSWLYMISNEGHERKMLYKVSAANGANVANANLQNTADVWDDLGGITYSAAAEKLYVYPKQWNNQIWEIGTGSDFGNNSRTEWPCCPNNDGATALAYNEATMEFYTFKNGSIAKINSDYQYMEGSDKDLYDNSSNTLSNIEGAHFYGDQLLMVGDDKVYMGYKIEVVSSVPTAIAVPPATAGTHRGMWVVVNAKPKDKLLKLTIPASATTSAASLDTTFSSDGIVDLPSGDVEAAVYIPGTGTADSYLFMVANEGSGWEKRAKLYAIDLTTGNTVNDYGGDSGQSLEQANVWFEVGGMAWDGTQILLFGKNDNGVLAVDKYGGPISTFQEKWPCCPQAWGANGLAYHAGTGKYYQGQSGNLVNYDISFDFDYSSGQETSLAFQDNAAGWAASNAAIKGMEWDQDLLYVAYAIGSDGFIARGGTSVKAYTEPAGIAYSPNDEVNNASHRFRSSIIGESLWLLLEGAPTQKIVKVDVDGVVCSDATSQNSDCRSFPASGTSQGNGFVDAPTKTGRGVGIAYLNDFVGGDPYLWIISNDTGGSKLYKISPTTGEVVDSRRTCDLGIECSKQFGGITASDDHLILFGKDKNAIYEIRPGDWGLEQSYGQHSDQGVGNANISGGRDVAWRHDKTQLISGRNNKLVQWTKFGSNYEKASDITLTASQVNSTSTIGGLAFKLDEGTGFKDDIVYIAYSEGTGVNAVGRVRKAGIPTDKTNLPRGVAYAGTDFTSQGNASNDHLYVLVDGLAGGDTVLKIQDPQNSSTVVAEFNLGTNEAEGMAFVPNGAGNAPGSLIVTWEDPNVHDHRFRQQIAQFTTDHTSSEWGIETGRRSLNSDDYCCDKMLGMAWNGESLVMSPKHGGPHLEIINKDNGNREQGLYMSGSPSELPEGMTAVGFRAGEDSEYVTFKGKEIFRFTTSGVFVGKYTLSDSSVTEIRGGGFGWVDPGDGSSVEKLFMGVVKGNSGYIHASMVPQPAVNLTTNPRGLATDGTDFYVILDATPKDKIVKINGSSGQIDTSWGENGAINAPDDEAEGIVIVTQAEETGFVQAGAYIVTNAAKTMELCNEHGCQAYFVPFPMIYKFNPATAVFEKGYQKGVRLYSEEHGEPVLLMEPVGDLAFDAGTGNFLMTEKQAGNQCASNPECGSDIWELRMDRHANGARLPSDPNSAAIHVNVSNVRAESIGPFYVDSAPIKASEGLFVLPSSSFSEDRRLVVAGKSGASHDKIARLSLLDWEMVSTEEDLGKGTRYDYHTISGASIKGVTFKGQDLYIAEDMDGKVYKTFFPEQTVETTLEDSYTVRLQAQVRSNNYAGTNTYSIARNADPRLLITSPNNAFVSTTSPISLAGYINDPAATRVTVGMTVPYIELANSNAETAEAGVWNNVKVPGNTTAEWHKDCGNQISPAGDGGSCVYRFGVPSADHFNGNPSGSSKGIFTLGNPGDSSTPPTGVLSVQGELKLSFKTWFQTRLDPEHDIKTLELAYIQKDAAGRFSSPSESDWKEIRRWVGPGFDMIPPMNAISPENWVLEQSKPEGWHETKIDLGQYAPENVGSTGFNIMLRFVFDSTDQYGFGKGWAIDNLLVAGKGLITSTVDTTALSTPVDIDGRRYFQSFTGTLPITEGSNEIGAMFVLPYSPFTEKLEVLAGFLDQTQPVVAFTGVPNSTNENQIDLTGQVKEMTFNLLQVERTGEDGRTDIIYTSTSLDPGSTDDCQASEFCKTFTLPVTLPEGKNTFKAIVTDNGGLTASTTAATIADFTPPQANVSVVTIRSQGQAVAGDQYIVTVAADDTGSGTDFVAGVNSVTLASSMSDDSGTGKSLVTIGSTPAIMREMYSLGTTNSAPTTHTILAEVEAGTPIGVNDVFVTLRDAAGNVANAGGSFDVVAQRSNRNYFLFPGANFMGMGMIPDDGNSETPAKCPVVGGVITCSGTEDPSLDRLMTQDITSRVNPNMSVLATSTTLGDIIETTWAYSMAGNFLKHSPGPGSLDTLQVMEPFQGMLVMVNSTVEDDNGGFHEVFKMVDVEGFTAQQAVPIRVNIQGVFFRTGIGEGGFPEAPPSKELRVGYNLIAPHVDESGSAANRAFDYVFRAALIPNELAVSALTFDRRVDASLLTDGSIKAQVFEGFVTNAGSDVLKPTLSYWTFIVDDMIDNGLNTLLDPKGPTITP